MAKVTLKEISLVSKEKELFTVDIAVKENGDWEVIGETNLSKDKDTLSWIKDTFVVLEKDEHKMKNVLEKLFIPPTGLNDKVHLFNMKLCFEVKISHKKDFLSDLLQQSGVTGGSLNHYSIRIVNSDVGNIPLTKKTINEIDDLYERTVSFIIENLSKYGADND